MEVLVPGTRSPGRTHPLLTSGIIIISLVVIRRTFLPLVLLSTDLKQCVVPCWQVLYVPSCSGLVHLNGLLVLAVHVRQSRPRTPGDTRFSILGYWDINQLPSTYRSEYQPEWAMEISSSWCNVCLSVSSGFITSVSSTLTTILLQQSAFKPVVTISLRTVQLLYLLNTLLC